MGNWRKEHTNGLLTAFFEGFCPLWCEHWQVQLSQLEAARVSRRIFTSHLEADV